MASVDLSQTHLKTVHVIAIVLALLSAGLYIGRTYVGLTWTVRTLDNKQKEIPTKDDLRQLHTDLNVEMTHAAAERAKFYLEHAKAECEPPVKRGGKWKCTWAWPPPAED
jgi:hypothetical protein